MKTFLEAKWFTKLIAIFAVILVALIIFGLGTFVGYRQAEFSSRWAGHYNEVFGGPRGPFMMGRDRDDLISSGGAIGKVIAVSLPTIAVKNPNEAEKVIIIGSNTTIRRFHDSASSTDIRVGDFIMTVGSPDEQGRIAATFVRIMPPISTSTIPMPMMGTYPPKR